MRPDEQCDTVVARLRKKGFKVERSLKDPVPRTFTPTGVLLHHTASTSLRGLQYEKNDIANLQRDQPGWPAPHVQWYVGRTATVWNLTDGCAYHAGSGGALANQGIPRDLGNQYLWGIEVQSDGYGMDWTDEQWLAVHALTGELLKVMNEPLSHIWRHKDYDDDSGKVDTRYSLDRHRDAVRKYLAGEQEDVMQAEDWDKLEKIVHRSVEAGVEKLLNSDVTKEGEPPKVTVREALRKAANL